MFIFKTKSKKKVKMTEDQFYMILLGALYEYAGSKQAVVKDNNKNPMVLGRPEPIAQHIVDRMSWPNEP